MREEEAMTKGNKPERPADRIMAGLREAIAFMEGEPNGCIVHTPESIIARRKARHRERAGLRVVGRQKA